MINLSNNIDELQKNDVLDNVLNTASNSYGL